MVLKRINSNIIDKINELDSEIIIELDNTKTLNTSILNKITNNKCLFKIWGGIKDIEFKDHYTNRIIYTLEEIKKIISEFESIEVNLPINKEDKVIYLYDYLRKNIKYTPLEIDDKKIRSLCVIYTKNAVCSGYSLVFKELLDRNGIKCHYIKHLSHAWNTVCINRKWYELDLTWDSCVYNKYPSSNIHYFANNYSLREKHNDYLDIKNTYKNDILGEYKLNVLEFRRDNNTKFKLTLLPIGINRKYYILEEDNNRYVISSEDDMEAIIAEYDNEIKMSYINCFFTLERVKKYLNNNISYLGYGTFIDNCFYRRKNNKKDNYIKDILISDRDIIIDTIDKKYIIYNNYSMEVLYVKSS